MPTGVVFIVGPAGSGKTELTAALDFWFREREQDVALVNLDPAVLELPYDCDVDVRDFVNMDELMEEYQLGPNGAMILAMNIVAENLWKINRELRERNATYIIVDTPGQMELFTHRTSGVYIAKHIYGDAKMVLFLYDAVVCKEPAGLVSGLLLSAYVYHRLLLPQLNVLTKKDLVSEEDVRKIVEWSEKPALLLEELLASDRRVDIVFTRRIVAACAEILKVFGLIPVNSKGLDGILNVASAITRVLFGGEERIE